MDINKYHEICDLLAEAYEHYFEYGEGYAKSGEGTIELITPPYFWGKKRVQVRVEIYSTVFGSGRVHRFNSLDIALEAVREWHRKELATVYCKDCYMDETRCWHSV